MLTFDNCVRGRDILESDRITNSLPKFYLHLFANAFGNRHSCHASRLRAANHSELTISILIEELCQLSGLARTGLSNDNDHYESIPSAGIISRERLNGKTLIVPDHSHEVFATCKCREIFALLLEGPCARMGAGGLLRLQVCCEPRVTFIIFFAFFTVGV